MQLPGIGIFGGQDAVINIIVPYLKDKGFRVEAFWALTFQDADRIGKELSIPFSTNKVDEVLLRKDVELVIILCPPNLHSQIAVKALGIGKHVLCDRPVGLSQCEALKMVLASNYYPSLICSITFSLRFHPAFIQLKKDMDKYVGHPKLYQCRLEMGSILGPTFNWLCDEVMGGGVVTLFGSHMVDLITYLTGQRASRVHAVTKTLQPQTNATSWQTGTRRITSTDFAVIQLEMDGGLFVSMTLSNQMPIGHFVQEISVFGTKGYLRADGAKVTGVLYSVAEKLQRNYIKGLIEAPSVSIPVESTLYSSAEDADFLKKDLPFRTNNGDYSALLPSIYLDGLLRMLGSLKDAFSISNRAAWKKETTVGLLGSGFDEGLYVQAVIEAIKDSARGNHWSKVNIMTEEPDPNPTLTAAVRTSAISL